MEKLIYKIDIEGYPYQRPRLGKYGNAHNPKKYSEYRKSLSFLLKQLSIPSKEYEYLRIHFYFSYPQSESKKDIVDLKPMNRKYDIDNLIKSFMDSLQDSGIISDDRCICGIYAEKLFTTAKKGWIEFEFE